MANVLHRATDADEGPNAAIRYAIIGGNLQGQFSIDSQSGEVSLMKPLDYENTRSFRLNIRAQGTFILDLTVFSFFRVSRLICVGFLALGC